MDLHKGNKRTRVVTTLDKYMIIFLLIKYHKMIIHCLNKTNINEVWGYNRWTSKLYGSNTTKLKGADMEIYCILL